MTENEAPDPIDVAVGARVRIRRQELHLSQTALATTVGITFQQVQKYEKGTNRISASMLVKIAATLETTVAALVGEDQPQPDVALLSGLATPGSAKLLSAFAKLTSEEQRGALLQLVRSLAVAKGD